MPSSKRTSKGPLLKRTKRQSALAACGSQELLEELIVKLMKRENILDEELCELSDRDFFIFGCLLKRKLKVIVPAGLEVSVNSQHARQ